MKRSLSIMVKELGTSQLSFHLINTLNTLSSNNSQYNIMVFYQMWGIPPLRPAFSMFMEREVWGIRDVGIATNINTAEKLIRCPGPKHKYFYIYDLEWTMMQNLNYESLAHIYTNPRLELIARTQHHADVITKVWKKPKYIMEDFDIKVMEKIINEV